MLNLSDLLAIVWSSAGWVIPFILIVTGLRLAVRARAQGWIGERLVTSRLDELGHAALHDIIVPDGRGGLTQIDHVVLNDQGLWVLETKTLTGRLFGRARDRQWTQRLGSRSFHIGNPLRQNYGHIKAVESIVGDQIPIHGRVVLAGSASFPKGVPDGVISRRNLTGTMGQKTKGALPEAWMQSWAALQSAVRRDKAARRQHRRQLEGRFGRDLRASLGGALLVVGLLVAGWMTLS